MKIGDERGKVEVVDVKIVPSLLTNAPPGKFTTTLEVEKSAFMKFVVMYITLRSELMLTASIVSGVLTVRSLRLDVLLIYTVRFVINC